MSGAARKALRQRAIEELVRREPIASQGELAAALGRRGFSATQATLSRDLRELRLARVPEDGGYRYHRAGEPDGAVPVASASSRRLRSVAALEVTEIDANEHCVVVRTLTGRAQGVAVWIDGLGLPELLATVAGDDTVLVLPRSVRRTARLRRALSGALARG